MKDITGSELDLGSMHVVYDDPCSCHHCAMLNIKDLLVDILGECTICRDETCMKKGIHELIPVLIPVPYTSTCAFVSCYP